MAFQFSKLQNEYLKDFCSPYCDIINNPSRICPPECTSYCNPNCLFPYPQLPKIDVPETSSYNYNTADHHQKIPLFLAFYLSIILTTIFLCFTSMYCKSWNSSRREESGPQPQTEGLSHDNLDQARGAVVDHPIWHIRSVGLESSTISSINTYKYKKGDDVVDGTECVVCLSEFQEDETLRLLPHCKHAFHTPCIDKWLKSHTSCPICRADLVINPVGMPSPAQHTDGSY